MLMIPPCFLCVCVFLFPRFPESRKLSVLNSGSNRRANTVSVSSFVVSKGSRRLVLPRTSYNIILLPRLSVCLSIYGCTALCWTLAAFSVSLSYTQSVGLLGRGISLSQGRYLHTEQHKHT
jgi:hypothetical protein